MNDMPVKTFASRSLQCQRADLWAALEAGFAVHLVHLRSGVHRGWLTAGIEPGYETTRIGCRQLVKMGQVLEAVREGTTYEIFDHQTAEVRGYLTWAPPRVIAEDPEACLGYYLKRRQGKLTRMLREEFPSAVATRAVEVSAS